MTEGLMGYFGMTDYMLGLDPQSLAEQDMIETKRSKQEKVGEIHDILIKLLDVKIRDDFEQQVFLTEEQYDFVNPSEV